jgi:hypothetical protein
LRGVTAALAAAFGCDEQMFGAKQQISDEGYISIVSSVEYLDTPKRVIFSADKP